MDSYDLPSCHSSQGIEGAIPTVPPLAGLLLGERSPDQYSCLWFMATVCRKLAPVTCCLQPVSLFRCLGSLPHSGTAPPPSFCDSGDSESMLSHLGFLPPLAPSTFQADFSKFWFYYLLLITLSGIQFMEAPSPCCLPSDISVILGSHVRTSYLAKSGSIFIYRIAASLFSDLWLISQVLRKIW